MKTIRQIALAYQQGKSDKVYEVDLCQVGDGQYVVNFRYGRRGSRLKDGTKTVLPVPLDEAEKIYTKLVDSKKDKGYWDSPGGTPSISTPTRVSTPTDMDKVLKKRRQVVLEQFRDAVSVPGSGARPLNRLAWRVGQLRIKDAGPLLMKLVDAPDPMTRYCTMWSLGRIQHEPAAAALEKICISASQQGPLENIAREAYRAVLLNRPDHGEPFFESLRNQLPEPVRNAFREKTGDDLKDELKDELKDAVAAVLDQDNRQDFSLLSTLYLLNDEKSRGVLLPILREAKPVPNYFQQFRRIFKAAEFRDDAEVFGILAHRFETEIHRVDSVGFYYGSKWTDSHEELRKPDSSWAYAQKSRDYLRRRCWRTLRQLADTGSDDYVKMAVGALLNVTDQDGAPPSKMNRYDWQTNRYSTTHYDAFSKFNLFNCILYGNSPRYKKNSPSHFTWVCYNNYIPLQRAPAQREEAFPHLWDNNPSGLLHLLKESCCHPVHQFAVKALRTNPDFLATLDSPVLAVLFKRPYPATNTLALELAVKGYDPGHPDFQLVAAMLLCPLLAVREQALKWVSQSPILFTDNPEFLAQLYMSPFDEVRKAGDMLLAGVVWTPPKAQGVVEVFIRHMLALPLEPRESQEEIARQLGNALRLYVAEGLRSVDLGSIARLMDHHLEQVRVFAGNILAGHSIPPEKLPPEFISQLIESLYPSVRATGFRLLALLPVDILFSKEKIVLDFCLSPQEDIRQAVRPIIAKMARADKQFGLMLAETLTLRLLEKGAAEDFCNDTALSLKSQLGAFLSPVSLELTLRLLKAPHGSVRDYGGYILLNYFRETIFKMRQIAGFAAHDILDVRRFAHRWCREQIPRVKADIGDFIRFFDAGWEDTRQFAFEFFQELYPAESVDKPPPAVLVGICDSPRHDVQQLGCQLLNRYFQEEHGLEYLMKLSQHPSTNLQLFVTNYLANYAAGCPDRLESLAPYFIRVLSGVNKGRAAKSRILLFLKEQSLLTGAAAECVSRILTRISATIAIGDKAACIEIMRDIKHAYPDIPLPISITPVNMRRTG